MRLQIRDIITKEVNFVNQNEDPVLKLQQENADFAFNLMMIESEAIDARQEVADLNFTLMMNGVI